MATKWEAFRKRLIKFVQYSTIIFDTLKQLWKMLKEIYNQDTLTQIEKIKEKSLNKE